MARRMGVMAPNSVMPQTPPAYVRNAAVPGSIPQEQGLIARARQEALGKSDVGKYGLDYLRRKKVVRPFTYTTVVNPVVVAANGTTIATVQTTKDAFFELDKVMCVVTNPANTAARIDAFTFRMRDDRKQLYLSNEFLHNLAATGSGIFPLILPQPKFFNPASTISIEHNNRTGDQISIFWALEGKNYYMREYENLTQVPEFQALSTQEQQYFLAQQKKFIEPYTYTLDAGSVTVLAGATSVGNIISIRQGGDFEIMAVTAFSDAPFTYQIRESATGRFITSGTIASTAGLGDGERPHILPESLWIDTNSNLLIDFTNLDGANPNEIFLHLIGRIWYDNPSQNLLTGPDFYFSKYEGSSL